MLHTKLRCKGQNHDTMTKPMWGYESASLTVLVVLQGRRYKGPNGKEVAATHIQASWRMFRDRSEYLEYRRRKWAAGVIAISWIMHIKMAKVRLQLKTARDDHLEGFRRRAKV